MVSYFVYFEYKKDFWHVLVKFIAHRVSLSSGRSNKKQFELLDLVFFFFFDFDSYFDL